jgi:arabinogalactan endo-1,4-beta-galactosidase
MKTKIKQQVLWTLLASGALMANSIQAQTFTMGADVSYVRRCEDKGAIWKNSAGAASDIFAVLNSYATDAIRLRVWVNPSEGYCNKADVLGLALRAKNAGINGLYLSFHYSDTWADPGNQKKPAAWKRYSVSQLEQAVHDHTKDVVSALMAQGTPPTMVSIGNEINCGMLWPDGNVCGSRGWTKWPTLAKFINAGRNGVRNAGSSAQIVLHISEGGDNNETGRWWFDNITSQGVQYDVIAISYYSYWHGPLSELDFNIRDLRARYGKPVIVAETAYPFTLGWADWTDNVIGTESQLYPGYPATPEGQRSFFQAVVTTAKNAGASAVFYWGGEWVAGKDDKDTNGSTWENQALFDFSWKALPALSVLQNN